MIEIIEEENEPKKKPTHTSFKAHPTLASSVTLTSHPHPHSHSHSILPQHSQSHPHLGCPKEDAKEKEEHEELKWVDTNTTKGAGPPEALPEPKPFKASDLSPLVRINVGGERFSTTIHTITQCPHEKGTYLQAIFEAYDELPKDEKGCAFIDRDPKYFRHILNWFRSPQLPMLGDMARANLLKEAQYFQLKGMISALRSASSTPEPSVDQLQILLTISKMKQGLHTVNLSGLNLTGLRLVGLEMKGCWFYESNILNTQFCYATLSQSKFIKSQLQNVDFSFADLSNANFSGALMKGVNFRGAKLTGVVLTNVDLSGFDLSQQNLTGGNLQGANLSKANLSGAVLMNVNLQGANLTGANLNGANLNGTDLTQAMLKHSNFTKAVLVNAKLGAALPNQTNFNLADLTGVKLSEDFKKRCSLSNVKGL